MIGGPDQGRWRRVFITEFKHPGKTIGQPEDQIGLNEKRNSNPQDGKWIGNNHLAFKGKKQNQRNQQRDNGDGSKYVEKLLFKPFLYSSLDDQLSGDVTRHHGESYVYADRKHQGLPGNRKSSHPQ